MTHYLFALLQETHATPAGQAAAEHATSPNVFSLTTNVMTWTLIIFFILFIVLLKFAFPPILGYAAEREKRIQNTIDESNRNREETERLLAEQRAEIAKARTEAQQIIAEGKTAAEKVRAELLNRARVEQEELIARAKSDIEAERLRAVESVRQQAVEIALAAAAKLVEQRLDAESDRRIVSDFLSRVGTGTGAGR